MKTIAKRSKSTASDLKHLLLISGIYYVAAMFAYASVSKIIDFRAYSSLYNI